MTTVRRGPMFSKILIANRGEIAVRVIRACRELGIASVAVYSEADRRALHVRLADEAVEIGPAPASESYLSSERILEAARQTGAQAIHPGYGFLAENAAFARAVQPGRAGLYRSARRGNRRRWATRQPHGRVCRQPACRSCPAGRGPMTTAACSASAAEIGYPVIVKAAAGGGGKGMRVVRRPQELDEALAAARREAQRGLWRRAPDPGALRSAGHHVEFQVLADGYGNVLHLFERECSVQRRHQKIIEETPSPLLDAGLREQMGAAAVAAAARGRLPERRDGRVHRRSARRGSSSSWR